jgi:signal peptidase II
VHDVPRQRLNRGNNNVLFIALAVTVADAASKYLARRDLAAHQRHVVGPLWLRLQYNEGISFSLNRGLPLLTSLGTVLVAIALLVVALRARRGAATWGFGLLVGGGVANVVDRLAATPQRVTDFISVGAFPVFNVADTCITIGFVLLLIEILRGKRLVVR